MQRDEIRDKLVAVEMLTPGLLRISVMVVRSAGTDTEVERSMILEVKNPLSVLAALSILRAALDGKSVQGKLSAFLKSARFGSFVDSPLQGVASAPPLTEADRSAVVSEAAVVIRRIADVIEADSTFQSGFPRIWELLRFLLGTRLRERVFEPAYNELLKDHLEAQSERFQTRWARAWIRCCFGLRTLQLLAQCVAVGMKSLVGAALVAAVPSAVMSLMRQWFSR